MQVRRNPSRNQPDAGIALLMTMFALLLISSVGFALIVAAASESALVSNYRSSTQVFYPALAGLEEGRGRLWPRHPNFFNAFVAPPGGTLPLGQVRYLINAPAGQTVDPSNLSTGNAYADFEYQQEFSVPVTTASIQTTTSVSASAGLAGPLYEWVRVNALTEQALGLDVNGDGALDSTTPLFYDGEHLNLNSQGQQALAITSLAVLPNGSRKMLQYVVGHFTFASSLPSALTLAGVGDTYGPPSSNGFHINGNDQASGGTCATVQPPRPAIGVPDNADAGTISAAIPANRSDHYLGSGGTPSVEDISSTMPPDLQSVTSLDGPYGLVQTIKDNADYIVQGPASSLPNYGSPGAPVIVVVNGDLSLSSNVTGYGVLVVTGNYSASGSVGWRGIVMVVGQGTVNSITGGGNNEYDGAFLVAKTRDSLGNLLPTFGAVTFNWSGGGGNGIYYNSCWLNDVQQNTPYRVLSFREISQ